jgi:formate/nitrite transporter FocA (FNT family)
MEPIKKVKNEVEKVKKEFKEKTLTLILGGFGLVAALAWNEAIKTLFETLLPKSSALIGKFIYAITVTGIVVFVSYLLKKVSEEK